MRHGEPRGGRRYRGQVDDPLSEKGWQQMHSAVAQGCQWDCIITSPLSRCIEFAKVLANQYTIPLEVDDRLKEIGFGEWEGKTASELTQNDPDILKRFYSDPIKHRPHKAELLSDFQGRVVGSWIENIQRHAGKHILIVGRIFCVGKMD